MIDQKKTVAETEKYVQEVLAPKDSGHDWQHIERVRKMALRIATEEGIDYFLVDLMALLHEMIDRKIIGHGKKKRDW